MHAVYDVSSQLRLAHPIRLHNETPLSILTLPNDSLALHFFLPKYAFKTSS